ncbi:hypothetical protein BVY01_02950 [bacterium I07]|nr:hypothetical protein BVY01_02950 [bacterium I07]
MSISFRRENMMFDDYIGVDSTPVFTQEAGNQKRKYLLWGDGVTIIQPGASRTKIRARGRNSEGWIQTSALGGQSLLEYYFIDVGQGDGVLIKTPDFKHIMIDGGYPRDHQDTGKSAADFVDWKFYEDYDKDDIKIDAMIATHCDADHYGGLWDLLNTAASNELDANRVFVKAFYHAGLGRWRKLGGGSGNWLGPYTNHNGEDYFTQLNGDRNAVIPCLTGGPDPQLQGWWKAFFETVLAARWANYHPTTIHRLSQRTQYLPGFSPNGSDPVVQVLAPVEQDINGQPGIKRFTGGDSINTNGNSILLRVDYGQTRTLLTGDLNKKSMKALWEDYSGNRQEFACDVAKACHHGSDDISYTFLRGMNPAVTIISSGDNEKHDHPRPNILAASATTGYYQEHNDELISPLIYSTELARSVSFGDPFQLDEKDTQGTVTNTIDGAPFDRAAIHFKEMKPGDLNPTTKSKTMRHTRVVSGLVYGLVNVRTDGQKILCAIMNEKNGSWQTQTLQSRF